MFQCGFTAVWLHMSGMHIRTHAFQYVVCSLGVSFKAFKVIFQFEIEQNIKSRRGSPVTFLLAANLLLAASWIFANGVTTLGNFRSSKGKGFFAWL